MKLKRTLAIGLALGALAASTQAQNGLIDATNAVRWTALAQAGQTQSDTQTSEINNGKKVVRVTTERDSSGRMVKQTTETDEYSGDKNDPKRRLVKTTKVEEDHTGGGKPKKTTTTSEYDDDGARKTTTTHDKGDGRAVQTGEEEKDGIGRTKKESEFDEKGKRTKTSEFDPPGHPTPSKVTEFDDKGKPKKVTDNDSKGKPTKVTDYEKGKKKKETEYEGGKPVRETEYDDKGRKKLVTELDEKGEAKKVTSYYPNGQKKEEAEAKDGKPTKKTTWDEKGNKTSEETFSSFFALAPGQAEPGQPFMVTVVDLNGHVAPNQEVVIDGGPHGKMTATSDLNGVVVAKTPNHWRAAHILVGGFVASMLLDGDGSGKPSGMGSPGAIGSIAYNGTVDPTKLKMTVGGRNAKILSASKSEINFITPAGLPPGPADVKFFGPGSEPFDGQPFTVVSIEWEPVRGPLTVGQKLTRNLVVKGTSEAVRVQIVDPTNDAAKVVNGGLRTSSGGANNVIPVDLHMVQTGSFNVRAELATQGQTDYERDLRNAEVADRDAAGWDDSAAHDSNATRAALKKEAAGYARRAAAAWRKGADARMKGDGAKAEALEKAAKSWEEAANQAGANADGPRAAAAADEARMWEKKAGGL